MTAIPRYRPSHGPAILSAGFRPFFLLAAAWAAAAVPMWLMLYTGAAGIPAAMPAAIWHAHEMVFGYAAATVAGFMLTAIPNWTGRMPLQGGPLASLALIWAVGRFAMLSSGWIGAMGVAILDLAFPLVFLVVVAREIAAGRNWRNLPMVLALAVLLLANALVHLEPLGIAATAELGNRLGIATLLLLISFVGGRIVPSFTRNWLVKQRPEIPAPATHDALDRAVLAATAMASAFWAVAPEATLSHWAELIAGVAQCSRLARWRGGATLREPLVWALHLGYGWLALGFLLLAVNGFASLMPQTAALHALTVGAIGTMTLAVMTRASLGHTGRSLAAGPITTTIYMLITLAAILRLVAPLGGEFYVSVLTSAGAAWSGAFALFVIAYVRPLSTPRLKGEGGQPI